MAKTGTLWRWAANEDMGAGGIDAYFAEVVRRPPMVHVCVEMKARDVAA